MRHFAVLLYLSSHVVALSAQQESREDSLRRVLPLQSVDSMRVEVMMEIAGEVYADRPDEAFSWCEQARQLSEKSGYDNGLSNAYGFMAFLHEQKGEIERALDLYWKSVAIFEKTGKKKDLSICYNNIAAIMKDQGRVDEALEYNNRSLQIKKEIGRYDLMTSTMNNIGLIYFNQGKTQEALKIWTEAIHLIDQIKNYDDLPSLYENLGALYLEQDEYAAAFGYYQKSLDLYEKESDRYNAAYTLNNLGNLYEKQTRYDSALIYYNRAYQYREAVSDRQGIGYSLKNIGWIYQKQGLPREALKLYQRSLDMFQQLGLKHGEAAAAIKLGGLLAQTNRYDEARPQLERALDLARQLGYPDIIRDAAGNLKFLYRQQGDPAKALEMSDLYQVMNDSLLNNAKRKDAIRARYRMEYERKEATLKTEYLKQEAAAKTREERQLLILLSALAGIISLSIFLTILLRQRNRLAREMKRSESLLLNILPAEIASELKASGEAKARHHPLVTVMFTDFTNFTLFSETVQPEELVREINYCYSRFDEIISGYGIEKIKTIGDSYMAASGLPKPTDTHAEDMVRAALDIQAFIASYFPHSLMGQHNGGIRIGIHTGPVVAGIVGIKKFAYDIWGDAVNVAARMESSGEAGKVNISEETYKLVSDKFRCTFRGKVEAKHKGEMNMYFVER